MPDLVDQLLAAPGLYVGSSADPGDPGGEHGHEPGVARIAVAPLPGGAGVRIDYEVLSPSGARNHDEHTMVARGVDGLFLVVAHAHATVATIVSEAEAGWFPAEGDQPFPMAIRIEVPEPGRIVYSWSYGRPGETLEVRDVADVRLVT